MKTVMYKDHDGNIIVEDYLDYLESYEDGLVPRQTITMSDGVGIDSNKLYKIANGSRDRLKRRCKFKNPKADFLFFVPAMLMYAWDIEGIDDIEMENEGLFCLMVLAMLFLTFPIIYKAHYELDDIIENYREKRWTRFPRK